jgi:hypothetical protein
MFKSHNKIIFLQAAVEAMLRTGVQLQLEWIRTTISHLHTASDDIKEIEQRLVMRMQHSHLFYFVFNYDF